MKTFFLDIETTAPDPFTCELVTLQVMTTKGIARICKDPENLYALKEILENSLIVGHNINFISKVFKYKYDITLRNVYDIQAAETLITDKLHTVEKSTPFKGAIFKYLDEVNVKKSACLCLKRGTDLTTNQADCIVFDLRHLAEITQYQMRTACSLGLEEAIESEMQTVSVKAQSEVLEYKKQLQGSRVKQEEKSKLKPIQTAYNGYHFRSRLEARWAVYFDAMGIKYEYEKEGFDLGEAGYYLPDFWLPEAKAWAEVKPVEFTDAELLKLKTLSVVSGFNAIKLIGIPEVKNYEGYVPMEIPEEYQKDSGKSMGAVEFPFILRLWEPSKGAITLEIGGRPAEYISNEVVKGVRAARSARFEHGETPVFN